MTQRIVMATSKRPWSDRTDSGSRTSPNRCAVARLQCPPRGSASVHSARAARRIGQNAVVDAEYAQVTGWLAEARHIVVLTGAGISTESGIPDFRGPQGVWTKNPAAEKTATLQHYVNDREVRRQAWRNRVDGGGYWTAEPNAGHRALVELERKAALDLLVTQNVDGLHHAAGSSPDKVIEIHGNVREVKCLSCSWRAPMQVALDRVRAGEEDPDCPECGGILKSAMISFGENLVPADLARAHAAASRADLFLAVGTSLAVYPAAGLPEYALANRARLVVMNAEPTPFDDAAAVVVREWLGTVLPAIVEALPDPTRLGISDP
jgi:NAD-dependent deacetylase